MCTNVLCLLISSKIFGKSFHVEIFFSARRGQGGTERFARADRSPCRTEEASSVDSGTETHSGLFISNVITARCRIAPLIFRWRARAGSGGWGRRGRRGRGGTAIKISFVLPRCRVSSFFSFSFFHPANKYPPPARRARVRTHTHTRARARTHTHVHIRSFTGKRTRDAV